MSAPLMHSLIAEQVDERQRRQQRRRQQRHQSDGLEQSLAGHCSCASAHRRRRRPAVTVIAALTRDIRQAVPQRGRKGRIGRSIRKVGKADEFAALVLETLGEQGIERQHNRDRDIEADPSKPNRGRSSLRGRCFGRTVCVRSRGDRSRLGGSWLHRRLPETRAGGPAGSATVTMLSGASSRSRTALIEKSAVNSGAVAGRRQARAVERAEELQVLDARRERRSARPLRHTAHQHILRAHAQRHLALPGAGRFPHRCRQARSPRRGGHAHRTPPSPEGNSSCQRNRPRSALAGRR